MATVRNPKGDIVDIPDKDLARATKQGYTPISAAEIQEIDAKKEAGNHPWRAAAEGAVHGFLDVATAIPRAIGAFSEATEGPNAVSKTLGQVTPDNVQRGMGYAAEAVLGGGPTPSAPYMQDAYVQPPIEEAMADKQRLAAANPKANFAGNLVGGVAGFELGGLGALGSGAAAGTAARVAGTTGKALAIGAEAAVVGGTTAVAQAAEEAHYNHSYLTGQQALVAGGLGTLFAGGLILGGKVAGKFLEGRRAPKGPVAPELEVLQNAAQPGGAADVPAKPIPHNERTTIRAPYERMDAVEPYGGRAPPEMEGGGRGPGRIAGAGADLKTVAPPPPEPAAFEPAPTRRATPPPALESTPTPAPKDGLSKPITEPDPSLAGGDDAFPRRTRYARGARDVFEPEYASHDLPLGGRKGAPVEPEELRAALNGEALNSLRRTEKVAKLMEVVPPGAHPNYIREMTEKQRNDLSDYIGVPKSSEQTWQALEDAVAAREGYTPDKGQWIKPGAPEYAPHDALKGQPAPEVYNRANPGAVGELPPTPEAYPPNPPALPEKPYFPDQHAPNPGGIGELPPTPEAYPPNAPTPGTYNPSANANPNAINDLPPMPDELAGVPAPAPYQPKPSISTADEATLGLNASDPAAGGLGGPAAKTADPAKAQGLWHALLGASFRHATYRAVGGGALGGMLGGPAGMIIGAAGAGAASAVGRGLWYLAKKSTTMTLNGLDRAMLVGEKVPGEWSKAMQAQAAKYGEHHFMGDHKTPEAAMDARYKGLQALNANNGAMIRDRVGEAFGPLAQTERGALQATVDAAHNGVDYLLAAAPKTEPNVNSLTPLTDGMKPTRSDINAYGQVYDAVLHPSTVLRDIANGTVTSAQIMAVKTVYPRWFTENLLQPTSERLRQMDALGKTIAPAQRKLFDTILDVHSGVDNDAFVKQYSDTFAAALAAQQTPPMPSGGKGGANTKGRTLRRASTISPRMETQTSTFLGGTK